jgi:hypothetical protein
MGCIILVAVNHDYLEEMRPHDFSKIERLIAYSDYAPKRFDSGVGLRWSKSSRRQSEIPGMVVSHYYDLEDRVPLLVTNDFMFAPDILMTSRNSRIKGIADLEADFSRRLKFHHQEAVFDLETFRNPVKGSKISLFCLYLDALNALSKNPHVMEDIIEYCESGVCNDRTFTPTGVIGFTVMGTLNENQDAICFPKGYHFDIVPITRREIQFTDSENASINAHFYNGDRMGALDGSRKFNTALEREILAGASYRIQPRTRKKAKPKSDV